MKTLKTICFCTALAAAALPVFAQDATPTSTTEASPLIQMLHHVPNLPSTDLSVISYLDYRALATAWEGVPVYPTWEDYTAETDKTKQRLWIMNTSRVVDMSAQSLWPVFQYAEDTEKAVGFDIFDVNQSVSFGTPPMTGMAYSGNFDEERIREAFLARDYEEVETEDASLLQRADGLDPLMLDLQSRDPANPFGGELGRKEPIALLPDVILNATTNEWLTQMIAATTDDSTSLMSQPAYLTAAHAALDGEGSVIQAYFADVVTMLALTAPDPRITEAQLKAVSQYKQDYGELPPYSLVALADRQEGDEQVIRFVLIYGNEATAVTAADEFTKRLSTFSDMLVTGSTTPLIDEEGGQMSAPRVYHDDETDLYAAIVEARYPMPASNADPIQPPGRLLRQWVSSLFFRRAFYPLALE